MMVGYYKDVGILLIYVTVIIHQSIKLWLT